MTTRREALLGMLTMGTLGVLPEQMGHNGPLEQTDDTSTDYMGWARVLARMELSAIKSSRPGHWRKLHYTGVIRWSDSPSVLAAYGIGRPDQTDDDCCSLLAWFAEQYGMEGPTPIVGCFRTTCKRSYCFLFEMEIEADELVDEPAWKRVYGERLRTWERDHGREVPRAFLV
jgi:hypothetical protein